MFFNCFIPFLEIICSAKLEIFTYSKSLKLSTIFFTSVFGKPDHQEMSVRVTGPKDERY